MVRLDEISYIIYECPYCKGRLSIPVDTPMIRFEVCPVCKERIDKSVRNHLEALIEIFRTKSTEIMLEPKDVN